MTVTNAAAEGDRSRVRDGGRTRELVLEGAMAEFTAKGFAGARIDAVAERAGVNVRSIYQHFESKAALFDAVLGDSVRHRHEHLVEAMKGLFDGSGDPATLFPLFRRVLADNPGWVRLMAWKELSEDLDADVDDFFASNDRRRLYRDEIALLDAGHDRGHLPDGLDSDLLVLALTALAAFPWFVRPLTMLLTGQRPESPEFLARYDAFLHSLGRAITGSTAGVPTAGPDHPVDPRAHRRLRLLGRALDRAGLAGAYGHCSLRLDEHRFLVTPPHPLRVLTTQPGVVVTLDGPLPDRVAPEAALDRELYRRRPDVGAVCTLDAAPTAALPAAGGPAVLHGGDESPADPAGAAVLAAALGARSVLVRPGHATVVAAADPAAALALAEEPVGAHGVDPVRAQRLWEYRTFGDPEAEPIV